jgi:hypothetical protein
VQSRPFDLRSYARVGRRVAFNVPMWRDVVFEMGRDVVVGSCRDMARIIGLPCERSSGVEGRMAV